MCVCVCVGGGGGGGVVAMEIEQHLPCSLRSRELGQPSMFSVALVVASTVVYKHTYSLIRRHLF